MRQETGRKCLEAPCESRDIGDRRSLEIERVHFLEGGVPSALDWDRVEGVERPLVAGPSARPTPFDAVDRGREVWPAGAGLFLSGARRAGLGDHREQDREMALAARCSFGRSQLDSSLGVLQNHFVPAFLRCGKWLSCSVFR